MTTSNLYHLSSWAHCSLKLCFLASFWLRLWSRRRSQSLRRKAYSLTGETWLNHVDWPPRSIWLIYRLLHIQYSAYLMEILSRPATVGSCGTTAGIGDAGNEWEWSKHIQTIEIPSWRTQQINMSTICRICDASSPRRWHQCSHLDSWRCEHDQMLICLDPLVSVSLKEKAGLYTESNSERIGIDAKKTMFRFYSFHDEKYEANRKKKHPYVDCFKTKSLKSTDLPNIK